MKLLELCSIVLTWLLCLPGFAGETPPEPATTANGPVQVYILSGQSNMVGIGQVTGGGSRWGSEFTDPVVSVYPGDYDPEIDYEKLKPLKTVKLNQFGGVHPTPYPGGGTQITRGFVTMKTSGVYEFRPGYGASTENIMTVNGTEVYRKEPGGKAVHTPIRLTAGKRVPFRIVYLNNQANGLGWVARIDVPGTLATVVREDGKFPYLVNEDGDWIERKDVWYRGVVTATGNKPLSINCGAGTNKIGPELGFGHMVGNHHEEPVLILKASQGNRSLGWDYLPPGSKRFEFDGFTYAGYKDSPGRWETGTEPQPINWYAGKQYDDCFGAAHEVLTNFDREFPQWKGRRYEIAGFVWWQGHKDGGEPYASRYEQNLVHLIKTLRTEFEAPNAPFVVGTIGFDGWEMQGPHKTVAEAQLAVSGERRKYPEFHGNVLTVETRDFWREAEVSPTNQGFHYNQNAETYMLVGEALGKGMVRLKQAAPDAEGNAKNVGLSSLKAVGPNESSVRFARDGEQVVISVRDDRGIGRATIRRTDGAWPKSLLVRLHLRGLESFRVAVGPTAVEWSVASTGTHPARVTLWDGKREQPLDKADPHHTAVRVVAKEKTIPLKGGYFEVPLPAKLIADNPEAIDLRWIDFYRR